MESAPTPPSNTSSTPELIPAVPVTEPVDACKFEINKPESKIPSPISAMAIRMV